MLFLFALVALLGACNGNQFFNVTSYENVVDRICSSPNTKSCVFIAVDFDVLWTQTVLTFANTNFTRGIVLPVGQPGYQAFAYSDAADAVGNTAVLTFSLVDQDHTKLDGEFRLSNGSVFVIENCGGTCHVLMELDTSGFEDAEPEDGGPNRILTAEERSLLERGATDTTTVVTYSLMIYYTRQFASYTPDIPLYVEQLIAETNQGYINSKIPVRVKVLCVEEATISDTFNLGAFRNMKGSDAATRNTADAATLLLSPGYGSYCGIGYLNTVVNGATFSIARKDCALGYYTLGHELGHNFGCHHNRETGTNNGFFDYGYGYHIRPPINSGLRTIMAYYHTNYRTRVNYYSSATVKINGNWSTGNATDDNARVITEQRFLMANIGNEENECLDETCEFTDWSNLDCPSCNCDCEPSICPAGTEVYSAQVQAVNGFSSIENITLGNGASKQFTLTSTNNSVWLSRHGFKCFNAEQFHLDSCSPDDLDDHDTDACCKNYRVRFCCRRVPSVALAGGSYGYIQYTSGGVTRYKFNCHYNDFELYSTKGTCNREIAKTPASMLHRAIVHYVAPKTILACNNYGSDYCYRFDPDSNQWQSAGNMASKDRDRTSVTVGNRIYAIGGYDQRTPIQVWSGGSWQAGSVGSPVPVYAACATFADGRIFLFGGRIRYANGSHLNNYRRVQILNLETNEWTIGAQFQQSHHLECGSVRIRGTNNILVVGGNGRHSDLYDFENDVFTPTGNLLAHHYTARVAEIDNGKYVLIEGEQESSSRGYGRWAQVYDPTSGTWSRLEQNVPTFIRGRRYPGVGTAPARLFKSLYCEV